MSDGLLDLAIAAVARELDAPLVDLVHLPGAKVPGQLRNQAS